MGEKNDYIQALPAVPGEFEHELLKNIKIRAFSASKRKTKTLFIAIFAPVTPEQDLVVDFISQDQKKAYLTVDRIRSAIKEVVQDHILTVVLLTISPFTGGWLCRPCFLGKPGYPPSQSIRVISRSCGAAFADILIDIFTKRGTPFLTADELSKAEFDDMMPVGPTDKQLGLLYRFQREIHEALEHRLAKLGKKHSFDFTASNDAWDSLSSRKGRPLGDFWAKQWNATPTDEARPVVNRFEFLGEAFGGCKASQIFHLKYLASIELETCPGDWDRNSTGITPTLFQDFLRSLLVTEDQVKRVFDTIEHRASSMIMAHIIARALGLDFPDETKCRFWVDSADRPSDEKLYGKLQTAFAVVHNLFKQVAVLPREKRHDFKVVRFWRAARWLSAAIAAKFMTGLDADINDFIQTKVVPLVLEIRKTQINLLVEDPTVKCLGREWIESLNLGKANKPMLKPTAEVSLQQAIPRFATEAEFFQAVSTSDAIKPGEFKASHRINAQAPEFVPTKSAHQTPVVEAAVVYKAAEKPEPSTAMPPEKHGKETEVSVLVDTSASEASSCEKLKLGATNANLRGLPTGNEANVERPQDEVSDVSKSAVTTVEQATPRSMDLSGLLAGSLNLDPAYLAQVMLKAAEIIKQEEAAKLSTAGEKQKAGVSTDPGHEAIPKTTAHQFVEQTEVGTPLEVPDKPTMLPSPAPESLQGPGAEKEYNHTIPETQVKQTSQMPTGGYAGEDKMPRGNNGVQETGEVLAVAQPSASSSRQAHNHSGPRILEGADFWSSVKW